VKISFLDYPISRLGRWLLLVLLMILPAGLAGWQFKPDTRLGRNSLGYGSYWATPVYSGAWRR
jgi:hypothetical protein